MTELQKVAAAAIVLVFSGGPQLIAQVLGPIKLPDGTRVAVRLAEQLSSATAKAGDPVIFEVVEDVLVDGQVVLKQGTTARGSIVEAAPKRRMGRAGRLSYVLTETKSVDGQTVRLRATKDEKGDSNVTATAVTTTAVAVFVPVAAPFFLLRKGKDITIAQGTRVEGFVDGEHTIQPTTTEQPAASTLPVTGATMTNADVLGLLQAGFGEDLIIAKVRVATPAFSLETSDLIELKKAGVSERVIEAMLQARKP